MRTSMASAVWALALLVASVSSQTCNKNNFYCLNNYVYQLCLDGSTTTNTQVQVCPQGTSCSSDCYEHCLPTGMTPCIHCKTAGGFYCPNENSFQLCLGGSNVTEPDVYNCANGTICSNDCSNQCTSKACTSILCAEAGQKVPNFDDNRKFYLCTETADKDVLTAIEYTCPGTAIFDAVKSECVKDTTEKPEFVCKGSGRFPDPNGNKGYYLCVKSSTGYISGYYSCPTGSTFNTVTLQCTTNSTSTTATPTSTPNPNTSPTPTTTKPPTTANTCTTVGKFPNPLNCNSYILCTATADSTLLATHYNCPAETFFNPVSLRCSTTRPTTCTVRSRQSVHKIEATYKCLESGRVIDPESCAHYYWCSPEDLKEYHFPCPDNSRFNYNTKKCTNIDQFECPK